MKKRCGYKRKMRNKERGQFLSHCSWVTIIALKAASARPPFTTYHTYYCMSSKVIPVDPGFRFLTTGVGEAESAREAFMNSAIHFLCIYICILYGLSRYMRQASVTHASTDSDLPFASTNSCESNVRWPYSTRIHKTIPMEKKEKYWNWTKLFYLIFIFIRPNVNEKKLVIKWSNETQDQISNIGWLNEPLYITID